MESYLYVEVMIDSPEQTTFERQVGQSYSREFAPAVVGYVAATTAVLLLVDFDTAGSWKFVVVFLPLLPALWGLRAIVRHLGRIDEMQRQAQLGALATGFGVAMMTALTIGFVSLTGLDTSRWGSWVIYAAGMGAWLITAMRRGAQF